VDRVTRSSSSRGAAVASIVGKRSAGQLIKLVRKGVQALLTSFIRALWSSEGMQGAGEAVATGEKVLVDTATLLYGAKEACSPTKLPSHMSDQGRRIVASRNGAGPAVGPGGAGGVFE
jgi:hypothetical protein